MTTKESGFENRLLTELTRVVADRPAPGDLAAATTTPQRHRGQVGGRVSGRSRWRIGAIRVATATGLAGLLVAGTLTVESLTVRDHPVVGAQAEAAEVLTRAANATEDTAAPLRPGQFRYVRETYAGMTMVSTDPAAPTVYMETLEETWIPADFDDEWLWLRHQSVKADPNHPGTAPEGPVTERLRARRGWFYERSSFWPQGIWSEPTPNFLAGLPRDPKALRDRLLRDQVQEKEVADGALTLVGDLLRSGLVPPDLTAALFRALALIPGIEVVNDTVDFFGRSAVGVAAIHQDIISDQMLFDRRTSRYLGSRTVLLKADPLAPGLPVGNIGSSAVETFAVDRIGVRPQR